MSTFTLISGGAWLLAVWAFILWGVEKLQISCILRVMSKEDRRYWRKDHSRQAYMLIGLKTFQVIFLLAQALFIFRIVSLHVSIMVHVLGPFLIIQVFLGILVVVFGGRKSLPKNLTINAGGQTQKGRWIQVWPSRSYYKGLILQDNTIREGYVETATVKGYTGTYVTVGVVPQPFCIAAWVCNIAALLVSAFLFIFFL